AIGRPGRIANCPARPGPQQGLSVLLRRPPAPSAAVGRQPGPQPAAHQTVERTGHAGRPRRVLTTHIQRSRVSQKVDYLFTNALVLTMDKGMSQYAQGAVAVQGDSIVAVGPQAQLVAEYEAVETVDCGGKVLMPGL